MFNPFKRSALDETPDVDRVVERAGNVRFLAGELLRAHVRANGLHKINKEAVRNAMLYAHSLELSMESYERELRQQADKAALAETSFTPDEDLSND